MKKHVSFFLALVLVLSLIPFSAFDVFAAEIVASGTCGENATWTLDDEGVFTVSGTGSMNDYLPVPRTPWYSHRFKIKKLVVEDGITRIGNHTFRSCVITEIDLADTVTEIGESAFEGCSFTELKIPESVTTLGANAFLYNNVRDFHVPATLTSIGDGALGFYDNSFWGTLTVDAKNPVYHESGNCLIETETKTVVFGRINSVIPSDGSVTAIGNRAFFDFSATEIVIPNTVTRIGNSAFLGSTLTKIDIPVSVEIIEDSAFAETDLTNVTIPSTVKQLGTNIFSNCTSLETAKLPDNMTVIPEEIFFACTNLKTVNIPKETLYIGRLAFSRCSSLSGTLVIPDKVKVIDTSAFSACSYSRIIVGNAVEVINASAFTACESLKTVSLPSGIKVVDEFAFSGCDHLEYNLDEDDTIRYLGNASNPYLVLCGITDIGIEEFIMRDETRVIYDEVFIGCGMLKNITLSKNLTSINYRAFYNCVSLEEIVLPETVIHIDLSAFDNCSSLEYYEKDNGLYLSSASNKNFAFMQIWSKSAETFSVLEGTRIIAEYAFDTANPNSYSDNLKEIIIPDSVIAIGASAFVDCGELDQGIVIPDSVRYIGNEAFNYRNYDLKNIYCEASSKPILWAIDWNTSEAVVHWNCKNASLVPENDFEGGTEIIVDEIPVIAIPLPDGMILDFDTMLCYDIYLEKEGIRVQPDGSVTVSVKAPDGIDPENAKVYYLSDDGTLTDMNAVYENGYFVFTTDHFSYYIIAEEKKTPEYPLGDANMDNEVNYLDYIVVKRQCMGTYTISDEAIQYADADRSSEVDYMDYIMIKRHCMGTYVII